MRLRGPLNYIGGKAHMAKTIVSLLDYSVDSYIEPFFGSGQVFFRKPPHKIEVINDVNNDLINFYLVWYEQKDKLIEVLERLPYSEALYKRWIKEWYQGYKGKDDFERAIRYFFLLRSSMLGELHSKAFLTSVGSNRAQVYYNAVELLNVTHERIKNAQIRNSDFRDVLKTVKDRPCLIYADPPYFGYEEYYKHEFTKQDHEDLAKLLNSLPNAKIIVSYYYFDGIEDLYPKSKWRYIEIRRYKDSSGFARIRATTPSYKNIRGYATELLILNYEPTKSIITAQVLDGAI